MVMNTNHFMYGARQAILIAALADGLHSAHPGWGGLANTAAKELARRYIFVYRSGG